MNTCEQPRRVVQCVSIEGCLNSDSKARSTSKYHCKHRDCSIYRVSGSKDRRVEDSDSTREVTAHQARAGGVNRNILPLDVCECGDGRLHRSERQVGTLQQKFNGNTRRQTSAERQRLLLDLIHCKHNRDHALDHPSAHCTFVQKLRLTWLASETIWTLGASAPLICSPLTKRLMLFSAGQIYWNLSAGASVIYPDSTWHSGKT